LISYSYILDSTDTGGKKWEYKEAVRLLHVDFEKTYDSVRGGLIEYVILMKLVRLIKII